LTKSIKELAIKHKFEVFIPYGEKINKIGIKRTEFICSGNDLLKKDLKNTCTFFLEFLTNELGKYYLANYNNAHNHPITTMLTKPKLTTPIKNIIKNHGQNFTSTQKLSEFLNKEYKIKSDYQQVYSEQAKIHREQYGQVSEDAQKLLELIQERSTLGLCNYKYQINEKNELKSLLYFSNNMEKIFESFHDVMIIDSTLNKNRFDVPLVNFIGIDNYGKSRIICIALISNEQQTSYEFIFDAFLKQMKTVPDVVFIDEDPTMIAGYFLFYNFCLKILI